MTSLSVVLEGPDGAGKTTLAKALRARYGSGYQHAGPPFEGATPASLTRYYAAMVAGFAMPSYPLPPAALEALAGCPAALEAVQKTLRDDQLAKGAAAGRVQTGASVVDRWALGETIYGPLFRGRSLVDATEWQALAFLLNVLQIPLVLCLPSRETCLANWRARLDQEAFKDRAQVAKVYEGYASWAHGGRPHFTRPRWTWVYDYEKADGGPPLFEFLDAMAERQR